MPTMPMLPGRDVLVLKGLNAEQMFTSASEFWQGASSFFDAFGGGFYLDSESTKALSEPRYDLNGGFVWSESANGALLRSIS